MSRYFIEVAYNGAKYSGFQIQPNAPSIQAEIEKALNILFKQTFTLSCSSRTDAGVHALSNFFHFDAEGLPHNEQLIKSIYNLNAILPNDIVVKNISQVADTAHSRFDALSRSYQYSVYQLKDPFIADRAYYFPYNLDLKKLQLAAAILKEYQDFTSFSKKTPRLKLLIVI